MQLDNKVDSILLYPPDDSSSATPTPSKTVRSAQQVARLIAVFDQTPLQAKMDTGNTLDVLDFHFRDGTISGFNYDPATGWTSRGMVLPPAFASLLKEAS